MTDMANSCSAQLDNVMRKFVELDARIDELCLWIDDNDTDTRSKLAQIQTSFNQDFVHTQKEISNQQQRLQESQKSNSYTHWTVTKSLKALVDRACVVERHAARITTLENKIQKNESNPLPPQHPDHFKLHQQVFSPYKEPYLIIF
jgi:septal ring factor EnvC (AmiA/AmiB activator)